MADGGTQKRGNAVLVAVWAAAVLAVFVAFRSTDLLKLPQLIGNLGGGPLVGDDFFASLVGLLAAQFIFLSWLGVGRLALRFINPTNDTAKSPFFLIANAAAIGAAIWSLVWFVLGLVGAYRPVAGIVCVVAGVLLNAVPGKPIANAEPGAAYEWWKGRTVFEWALLGGGIAAVVLALIASAAPPIAKDTLLYHFAVPKAFVAQGSNAFIDGNIASYLALGAEMHAVWAMLLGNLFSQRASEAAAGVTTFLFFPLLITAVYGWARELAVARPTALVAAFAIASIPTAFHVASSGYIDLALALYVVLATAALGRWWRGQSRSDLILIAIFLGAALSIKLTSLFVVAAFALVILLRGREEPAAAGKVVGLGFAALVLAGVVASPWYLRNWATTGSPVFPFYMGIWKGEANGWDVERSTLFQHMNSQYGGADVNKTNYLTAPLRVSLAAQPENPELYDGVVGAAFLIGLPLLIFAIWRKRVCVEVAIAAGVAGIVYLFWLFSSPQLRYLLPVVPLLAVGIAAAIDSRETEESTQSAWRYSLAGASAIALLTGFAWFCMRAPLRVVLGGEPREQYLARNLDYYPYYQSLNAGTEPDERVWLINMRRDTYHIDRPVFSDYLFEDWTLRRMVWEARSVEELRAKTAAMNVRYILARHDFLLNYDRSTLVDDKRPRAENEAKLKIARDLLLDPKRTVKADEKFSLVKVF